MGDDGGKASSCAAKLQHFSGLRKSLVSISRCSKLFYTISRCYFHIESTFSGASIFFVLSHIARYDPLRFPRYRGTEIFAEENSCIPITHFQCKTHFEHLLKKYLAHFCGPWGLGQWLYAYRMGIFHGAWNQIIACFPNRKREAGEENTGVSEYSSRNTRVLQ